MHLRKYIPSILNDIGIDNLDPMVRAAAISASFACAETLTQESRYIDIVQILLCSPIIVQILGLQVIVRT